MKYLVLLGISIVMLATFFSNKIFAQSDNTVIANTKSLQYGIAFKSTIELNKIFYRPIFRLALNAGLGLPLTRFNDVVYPTENIEIAATNGGISTNKLKATYLKNWTFSIVAATTITLQLYRNNFIREQIINLGTRNSPLYYYENNTLPCLQNPYDGSVSIGKNIILQFGDTRPKLQSVGFFNGHFKELQISYYNDGGPILQWLGDKKDRYNTGGLTIALNLSRTIDINHYEVSYKKYTGYTKNAFEMSNNLNFSFANYKSTDQQLFNRSYWQLSIGNINNGLRSSIRWNNPDNRYDLQNYIHYDGNFAYHPIPYPAYLSACVDYNNVFTINKIR
jgi:hypothetical protein